MIGSQHSLPTDSAATPLLAILKLRVWPVHVPANVRSVAREAAVAPAPASAGAA